MYTNVDWRLRSRFSALILAVIGLSGISPVHAQAPIGKYEPPRVGRALYGGGWMQSYNLAEVTGSPEFSFPMQLVYQNNHESVGIFGPQWFCPQLESTLIPKGPTMLLWTKPDGSVMALQFDGKHNSTYRDYYGLWEAKVTGAKVVIRNNQGWEYEYAFGKLNSITSPSKRMLVFQRVGGPNISGIYLYDPTSKYYEALVLFGYRGRRVNVVQVREQKHVFDYFIERDQKLAVWSLPTGKKMQFLYDTNNVLLSAQFEKSNKVCFSKIYMKPPHEGAKGGIATGDPVNYWLKEDSEYTYKYGKCKPSPQNSGWTTADVSAQSRTGVQLAMNGKEERGMMTQKAVFDEYLAPKKDSQFIEKKTTSLQNQVKYYYMAPGQKYNGKLRCIEEGGKLVLEYRYDQKTGLLSETTDVNNIITFYEYDLKWRPKNRERWEPQPVRVSRGMRKSVQMVGEYGYDDNGQLAWAKNAQGDVTHYNYDLRGDLVQIIDPGGQTTAFTYDVLGRRTGVVRGGQSERLSYDPMGHIQSSIATDGTRTDYVYDKMGNVVEIKQNGKTFMDVIRDAEGKIVGKRDALGREKKIQLDAKGQLLSETAPNGSVTRYEYDSMGHRITQIDGNGNKITFRYDALGRLREQRNPLGNTLMWNYDTENHLVEKGNGIQKIKYTYDKDEKLSSVDCGNPGQNVIYTYDRRGRILTASTPTRSFAYYYDSLSRIEALQIKQNDHELVMNYRYNSQAQKSALILSRYIPEVPSKGDIPGKEAHYEFIYQTEYQYDSTGHLTAIKRNGQNLLTYTYDAMGRMASRTYSNGMKSAIGYDDRGRLSRIEIVGGPLSTPKVLTYTWDAANQVTRRYWNGELQTFEYDPSGQLLKVWLYKTEDPNYQPKSTDKVELAEAYTYDKAGNIIEQFVQGEKTQMTYNAANELVERREYMANGKELKNSTKYTYDVAGRMTTLAEGKTATYGWLDKLVGMNTPGGNINYDYYPGGQLAEKQSSTTSEKYLWDGLALIQKNNDFFTIEPHANGGSPIASGTTLANQNEMTFYINDLLGTTLARITGNRFEPVPVSAFGKPLNKPMELKEPTPLQLSSNQ